MNNTYNLQTIVVSACLVPTMGTEAAVGFVAFAKQSGTNVVVDVFVAVSNAADIFLSVESVSAATSIPANVGWYSGDPTSIDNRAESLIGVAGFRIDRSDGTSSTGGTTSTVAYGNLVSHLVFKDTDGDGVIDLHDYCPTLPRSAACNGCPRDLCCAVEISHNDQVDGIDLGMLIAHWGPCTNDCVADISSDGLADGADLGILLHDWAHCPG